jgi:PAS domain-containing protein
VDRIEPMGLDATVIGTDGRDLHFTTVRLGRTPAVAGRHVREGASQGELRSHGFFYKPDNAMSGVLGLPIRRAARPGYEHLFRNSAAIVFLRNEGLRLRDVGELAAHAERVTDDACRASCVDWYGNARPLFINGRIFALLGYELVEGRLRDGRLEEVRRISYAPGRIGTM